MSPILVRPVREQLEHDRVIRLLQQDLSKRKVEVGINPGTEQNASVGAGSRKEYPDVVLYSIDKGRKVIGVLEVETGESVNHLEAMAQWAHLAKLKVPFHLYVPMGSVDVARRLSADHSIPVTEIWSYHQVGDQFRFTLIHPVASRGSRGAPPPRTVSVASIRVAQLPEIEAPVEEAPPPPAPVTPPAPGRRVVAAKAKVQPAAQPAPVPPTKAAKGKPSPAAKAAPAAVPSKPVPTPAKVAVDRTTPAKSSSAKASPGKPSAARPAQVTAVRPGRPVSKATARPAAKPAQKAVPRASQQRAARPAARPSTKAARAQRPKAVVKVAPKASGRRK